MAGLLLRDDWPREALVRACALTGYVEAVYRLVALLASVPVWQLIGMM